MSIMSEEPIVLRSTVDKQVCESCAREEHGTCDGTAMNEELKEQLTCMCPNRDQHPQEVEDTPSN